MTRIATLQLDDVKPYYQKQPEGWKYTGAPSCILIDADDLNQWELYADDLFLLDEFFPNPADHRSDRIERKPQERMFGYNLGYYPADIETGEVEGYGPLCAECAYCMAESIELPIAFHCEIEDREDEDSDGTYARCCIECGEVLYELED